MFNSNDDDIIKEKVSFDCSIKNCKKNTVYKIKILNEDKSLGEFSELETEEKISEDDNTTIIFKTLNGIEFRFSQRQLFKVKIMKKISNNILFDNYERLTMMSSLVSSPNSIYERKVDENDKNSEIFSIEVKTEKNIKYSEFFLNYNILDYFKEGAKFKLLFFVDFSGKDNTKEYLRVQNIFYTLMVYFYNYCNIYTDSHEIYIFEIQEIFNYDNNYISVNSSNAGFDFTFINTAGKILEYFTDYLNKDIQENQIYISPFIERSIKEIEQNYFNVLFIFIKNLPEDIKIILDKIKDIKKENKPMCIILINIGDNFSYDLNNKIKECSNIILVEIKEESQNYEDIVKSCLNDIGKKIIEYKQNQQDNKVEFKENINSINISFNYEKSIHSDEENNEKEMEENKNSIMNNNIKNSKENNIKSVKKLESSENIIEKIDNPYSKNIYMKNPYSRIQTNSIKESENESDSEYNKKSKEVNEINISNQIINKDYEKAYESKMVDSKAKTDSSSFNNKIIKSKYFCESNG